MTERQRRVLVATLTNIAANIEKLRQRRSRVGEQDTKAVLIEPLLGALGWDLQNLDDVSREYRRKPQDNPVDYALFLLRLPYLFVEAKALDTDLSDRRWVAQTIAYAVTVGVEWCVLTNGAEYHLYNAHAPVDVEEKLFRKIRLSDSPIDPRTIETLDLLSKDKMGEKLINLLWKAHFVDRQVKSVFEELIRNPDASLVRLLRKRTEGLTASEIERSLKRADVTMDFPAVSMSPEVEPKEKSTEKARAATPVNLKQIIEANLIRPPMELEVEFKKTHLTATIQRDGTVLFNGKTYKTLSAAAGMARNHVSGPPPDGRKMWQTNGWSFWKYRDSDTGKLEEMNQFRRLHPEARG